MSRNFLAVRSRNVVGTGTALWQRPHRRTLYGLHKVRGRRHSEPAQKQMVKIIGNVDG